MAYLIYHAPDDAHLVRPLKRFLDIAEVGAECHERPVDRSADGYIVICGEGFGHHPWLARVLREQDDAIAVLIAPVETGIAGRTTIDLRAWPARSADRTLVSFVDWLKQGRQGTFGSRPAPDTKEKARNWFRENAAAVILMAVVGAGLIALSSIEQTPAGATARDTYVEQSPETQAPSTALRPTQHPEPALKPAIADEASGGPAVPGESTASTPATAVARPAAARPAPTIVTCTGQFGFGCADVPCGPLDGVDNHQRIVSN